MREWHAAGYFTDDMLVTDRGPDGTFVPLSSAAVQLGLGDGEHSGQDAAASPYAECEYFYRTGAAGKTESGGAMQGPFSLEQMLGWTAASLLPAETLLVKRGRGGGGAAGGSGTEWALLHTYDEIYKDMHAWWYALEEGGEEQGPFPSSTMAEWWAAGHLSPALLVRNQFATQLAPISALATRYFE